MALFGKLFSKETCAICGKEAGLTSKREVADGFICKDCEAKLSPWFQARKESSVEQIRAQLAAREQNRAALSGFTISRSFGDQGAFFFDDARRSFCALADASTGGLFDSKRITDVAGLIEANPDIISFDQVRSVRVDIDEIRNEVKHSVDGKQESYSPKHWRYGEQVWVVAEVDHPYVSTIRVPLGAVTIEVEEERLRNTVGRKLAEWLLDEPRLNLERSSAIYDDKSLLAALTRGGWEMPDYSYGFRCSARNWESIQRYGCYLAMAEQVRSTLAGA